MGGAILAHTNAVVRENVDLRYIWSQCTRRLCHEREAIDNKCDSTVGTCDSAATRMEPRK